ncbi:MAG: glycosyltransferase [Azonexus sp.]|jgi:glycosyltransferase involved in cell wall biosynthesis|nr:glycosyltransferase [Azonexus sp.]
MPHRIDIIIPCRNDAHFLDDCLTAISRQSRADFSVWLIDNASTDDTAARAAEWTRRDDRIHYHRNDSNLGFNGALQRGYELSGGDYVVILPADALWEPEFLEQTGQALDQNPQCAYAYTSWDKTGAADEAAPIPHEASGPVDDMPFFLLQNYIPLPFGLFRRSACEWAGGPCPLALPQLADLYLWLRLAAEGAGYFINQPLGHLRADRQNAAYQFLPLGRRGHDPIHLLDLVFASDRWAKPLRLLAKARQIQLLTGEKISAAVRDFGSDETLPMIRDLIEAQRNNLYLLAATAIRGYPEAAALNDTADDADELEAEVMGDDSTDDLLGEASRSSASRQREINRAYAKWLQKRGFIAGDMRVIEGEMARWPSQPTFRILLRVAVAEKSGLAATLDSLNNQFYGNWRIDVVTESPPPAGIEAIASLGWHSVAALGEGKAILDRIVDQDGDWLIELPPGAVLDPFCLWRIASEAERQPEMQAFYVDDDVNSPSGKRLNPRFKGQLNLEWSRSADLIGPLFVRHSALRQAGGVSASADSPWYDLLLRLIETSGPASICGIPDVLMSFKENVPTSPMASMEALAAHLTRLDENSDVMPTSADSWRVIYYPAAQPLISILIPSARVLEFIRPGVAAILEKTAYVHYEIIIVTDDKEADPELQHYLAELPARGDRAITVLAPEKGGRAAALNQAARYARGDYLVLLGEDARILQEKWLDELLAQGQRPGIGAVTPKQVQPHRGMIENAGYTLGINGLADAPGRHHEKFSHDGYMGMFKVCRDVAAVPTSCLLLAKADYLAVGGLDERLDASDLAVDLDFSLKLRAQGRRLIYTPFVTAAYYGNIIENSNRIDQAANAEKFLAAYRAQEQARQRWQAELANDRLWNPNLSLASETVAIETRHLPTWRYLPGRVPRIFARPLTNGQGTYRITQPLRAAREAGLVQECEAFQEIGGATFTAAEIARCQADAHIAQCYIHDAYQLELQYFRAQAPDAFIVYANDDLLIDMPLKSVFRKNIPADARRRYQAALRHCNRLVVSTEYLAETSRHFIDDIRVVPNRLAKDMWLNIRPQQPRFGGKPRIGWAGGSGHQGDLELMLPVIEATRHEADWVFFGMCPKEIRPLLAEYHELVDFRAYPQALADLNFDIAVAPLEDIPFNYGKSNLRLLDYGALGLPVVCTDILPYQDSPATRVPNRPDRWIAALRERLHDLDAARQEGARMRQWVEENYVLEEHLEEWLAAHLP